MAEELVHCSAAKLVVYPPKSSGDENEYKSGKNMEEVIGELKKKKTPATSDDHPLIVVAPAPAPHPPGQGKQLPCSPSPLYGKKHYCN